MTTFTQRKNGKWRVKTARDGLTDKPNRENKPMNTLWLDTLATIAALGGALYLASLIS